MVINPFFHTVYSISDSLKTVLKSVLIYETIIPFGCSILTCGLCLKIIYAYFFIFFFFFIKIHKIHIWQAKSILKMLYRLYLYLLQVQQTFLSLQSSSLCFSCTRNGILPCFPHKQKSLWLKAKKISLDNFSQNLLLASGFSFCSLLFLDIKKPQPLDFSRNCGAYF